MAYTAGVVDGDGFFTIVRDGSYDPTFPYYRIKIGIKQLWPGQGVRFIAQVIGGQVAGPERWKDNRPIARWEVYQQGANSAISSLLPYLRVKTNQAKCLLRAHRIIADAYRSHPERKSLIEDTRIEVMELNRGISRVSTPVEVNPQEEARKIKLSDGEHVAYLAGVMDSDGYFKIEKRSVKRMINPHYRIKIGAGQVAPSPAIELLSKVFGGTIRIRGDGRKGHRPIAHWGLFDRSAVPALEALLPYLVIKAPQARLLLQLRELKARGKLGITEWTHKTRWQRPIKMRKRCYSKSQVRAFDRLYRTVKALHADSPPLTLPLPPDETRPPLTGSSPRCR